MPVKCLYFCFVVLLTLNGESHGHPPEPCATFALKNGRVEFALHKNGRPVANATIQIIDGRVRNSATATPARKAKPLFRCRRLLFCGGNQGRRAHRGSHSALQKHYGRRAGASAAQLWSEALLPIHQVGEEHCSRRERNRGAARKSIRRSGGCGRRRWLVFGVCDRYVSALAAMLSHRRIGFGEQT